MGSFEEGLGESLLNLVGTICRALPSGDLATPGWVPSPSTGSNLETEQDSDSEVADLGLLTVSITSDCIHKAIPMLAAHQFFH